MSTFFHIAERNSLTLDAFEFASSASFQTAFVTFLCFNDTDFVLRCAENIEQVLMKTIEMSPSINIIIILFIAPPFLYFYAVELANCLGFVVCYCHLLIITIMIFFKYLKAVSNT